MLQLWGAYPETEHIVHAPSVNLRNTERAESRVAVRTAVDGSVYTNTKKQPDQVTHQWQCDAPRLKALEIFEFLRLYAGKKCKVIDHDSVVHIGYFRVNPIQLNNQRRSVIASNTESVIFELEFLKVE